MSKLFVRLTVILLAVYMILCNTCAFIWQINLWSHTYTVLLEICLCLCISAQGNYHCKFIRWTAYAICLNDAVISLDELFDFLPYTIAILVPIVLPVLGLITTTSLAINHYVKVRKLKKIWKEVNQTPQS